MADFWDEDFGARLDAASATRSARQRGQFYEDLLCAMFESVVGITDTVRNQFNPRGSQEIDIVFWNDQIRQSGLWFLPERILVECKNWTHRVSSVEVAWFDTKLRQRGQNFGILFAASGVTGDRRELLAAHDVIARALAEGRELVVITNEELRALRSSDDLVQLLRGKMMRLTASSTSL